MRKNIYAFGIATFLAMFIFTIATSLTNPFYGMSEAAIAQASSTSSSGTGTGNNCINQDCETPCDKDYSRPPIEKAREYINTTICCEYRYHYFDGNGNLIEVTYPSRFNLTGFWAEKSPLTSSTSRKLSGRRSYGYVCQPTRKRCFSVPHQSYVSTIDPVKKIDGITFVIFVIDDFSQPIEPDKPKRPGYL